MRLLPTQPSGGCGQLARSENPVSHTDAHRPEWVQLNDHRGAVLVAHSYQCHRSGGADCDLPAWPITKHDLVTGCCYYPTAVLSQRINGYSYAGNRGRKANRRSWLASERTAQRAILRSLTRDAMYGDDVNEAVIDNRQAHRHVMWGGGWWD